MVLCEAKTPPYLASLLVSFVQFSNCPQLFSRKLSFYGIRKREKYPFCLFRAGGWQRMGISGFFYLFPFLLWVAVGKNRIIEIFYTSKKELETRKKTLYGVSWNIIVVIIKKSFWGWSYKNWNEKEIKSYTRRSLRKTSIAKLL